MPSNLRLLVAKMEHVLNTCGEVLGFTIFGIWTLATVLGQSRGRISVAVRRYDHFNIVPSWTFFAPTPGMLDYHIVARDIDVDGKPCSAWQEVELPVRAKLRSIWNPEKRQRKLITDYIRSLALAQTKSGQGKLPFSAQYIACLQFTLTYLRPSPFARSRQFGIASTHGQRLESTKLVFCSVAHPIE